MVHVKILDYLALDEIQRKTSKTREILCSNDHAGFKKVFVDNVLGIYALLMDIWLNRCYCIVMEYFYAK